MKQLFCMQHNKLVKTSKLWFCYNLKNELRKIDKTIKKMNLEELTKQFKKRELRRIDKIIKKNKLTKKLEKNVKSIPESSCLGKTKLFCTLQMTLAIIWNDFRPFLLNFDNFKFSKISPKIQFLYSFYDTIQLEYA